MYCKVYTILIVFILFGLGAEQIDGPFKTLNESPEDLVFSDKMVDSKWQDKWFLDGQQAKVSNSEEGLELNPLKGFAVLWTKAEFKGDLRIEYDFKRLDKKNWGVNIIYIQAQGDGENGCSKDISEWSDKRKGAAMKDYFMNMHTYHISYAAYANGGKSKGQEYIRARRYLPLENKGLKGTELEGEHGQTQIFEDQKWVHVTIIKKAKEIQVEYKHPDKTVRCSFKNVDKAFIKEGRIGLRIMPNRKSMFKNFKIYQLKGE